MSTYLIYCRLNEGPVTVLRARLQLNLSRGKIRGQIMTNHTNLLFLMFGRTCYGGDGVCLILLILYNYLFCLDS